MRTHRLRLDVRLLGCGAQWGQAELDLGLLAPPCLRCRLLEPWPWPCVHARFLRARWLHGRWPSNLNLRLLGCRAVGAHAELVLLAPPWLRHRRLFSSAYERRALPERVARLRLPCCCCPAAAALLLLWLRPLCCLGSCCCCTCCCCSIAISEGSSVRLASLGSLTLSILHGLRVPPPLLGSLNLSILYGLQVAPPRATLGGLRLNGLHARSWPPTCTWSSCCSP